MSGETILFLMRNLYYLRNFERPIRALAKRGHRVTILASPTKKLPTEIIEQARALEGDHRERIRFGPAGGRRDFRRFLSAEIHAGRDILRYYTPGFRSAGKLRRRAVAKATPLARLLFDRESYWDPRRNREVDERLARWDEWLPPDKGIRSRIREIDPRLMIVTPLVDLRSTQIDWVRAARSLGVPTVLAVASWDNLTSKSRIQAVPDRVIVWNEIQRKEAVELHGIPAAAITVTGAQLYDDWFERRPAESREDFFRPFGFDPERPLILYAGSSQSISGNEPAFVRRWLEAVRASSDPALRTANVLVRPHPMNQGVFAGLSVDGLGPAAVHPLAGGFPVTERDRALYFDSLFHCRALVGLNTSALVEASILGKPCYTIHDSAHAEGQQDTIHYHYLTAGRILHELATLDEHAARLAAALRSTEGAEATRDFIREFIRPRGWDVPATPIFVDAIEAAAMGEVPLAARGASVSLGNRIGLDAAALAAFTMAVSLKAARGAAYRIRGLFANGSTPPELAAPARSIGTGRRTE